ncbi:MAG: hypothetical protein ACO3YY_07755 [Phycisphaerales bacterium]|jgi:hypothetical protein
MPSFSRLLFLMRFGRGLDSLALDDASQRAVMEEVRSLMESDHGPLAPLGFGASTAPDAVRRRRAAGRLVGLTPLVPAAMMSATFIVFLLLDRSGSWTWLWLPPLLLVQVVATLFVVSWILRRSSRPYLAAVLKRRGIAMCERCGYTLNSGEAITEASPAAGRCPECGWCTPSDA